VSTTESMNDLVKDKKSEDGNDSTITEKTMDTNDTVFYRIISKNVHEYQFIIPSDKRVELGQIFSIDDDEITFLARVTDIQHDSNYAEKWDTTIKGKNFYDRDQYFNKVVTESFGCIVFDEKTGKKKVKKSKTLPKKFSEAKDANQDELKFIANEMGDIEVGYLRSGSRKVKDVPVALESRVMDHHMGIFATTGMGKSNFMKVFTASCIKNAAQNKSPFGLLIVDPHEEYLRDLRRIQVYKDGLICYSTKKGVSGVTELTVSKEDISPEDVKVLLSDLTNPQKEILETIKWLMEEPDWQSTGDGWIDKLLEGDGVEILKKRDRNEIPIRNLAKRIETLIKGRKSWIDVHSSIPGIIKRLGENKVVLIDMPGMSEWDELFLLSILSKRILDQYKVYSSNNDRKCCLITIEEAQRVLGGGEGSIARFADIAREGRKFGVGLCAVTQQPKLIDKRLLSQFNTLVVMGLADRNDRDRLEESAKQDLKAMDAEIQTLEPGEAIISTLNVSFPIPAIIHPYEEYLNRLNAEKNHQKSLVEDMESSFEADY
jgi:uncharacterized protein